MDVKDKKNLLLLGGAAEAVGAEVHTPEEPSLVMHPQEGETSPVCLLRVEKSSHKGNRALHFEVPQFRPLFFGQV